MVDLLLFYRNSYMKLDSHDTKPPEDQHKVEGEEFIHDYVKVAFINRL